MGAGSGRRLQAVVCSGKRNTAAAANLLQNVCMRKPPRLRRGPREAAVDNSRARPDRRCSPALPASAAPGAPADHGRPARQTGHQRSAAHAPAVAVFRPAAVGLVRGSRCHAAAGLVRAADPGPAAAAAGPGFPEGCAAAVAGAGGADRVVCGARHLQLPGPGRDDADHQQRAADPAQGDVREAAGCAADAVRRPVVQCTGQHRGVRGPERRQPAGRRDDDLHAQQPDAAGPGGLSDVPELEADADRRAAVPAGGLCRAPALRPAVPGDAQQPAGHR